MCRCSIPVIIDDYIVDEDFEYYRPGVVSVPGEFILPRLIELSSNLPELERIAALGRELFMRRSYAQTISGCWLELQMTGGCL